MMALEAGEDVLKKEVLIASMTDQGPLIGLFCYFGHRLL